MLLVYHSYYTSDDEFFYKDYMYIWASIQVLPRHPWLSSYAYGLDGRKHANF